MAEIRDSNPSESERLTYLSKYADYEVSDRDIALGILSPDYEAQLFAIHALLSSIRKAEDGKVARLRKLKALRRAQPGERLAENRVDRMYSGFAYQDATHFHIT